MLTTCVYCAHPVESWQCHPCSATGTLEQIEVKELAHSREGAVELGPETWQISAGQGFQGRVFFTHEAAQTHSQSPLLFSFICPSSF